MQFTFKFTLTFVLLLAGATLLAACDRTRPIYEVRDQSITKSLTLDQVKDVIVRAGVNKG